ncbi:hypothetical protein Tco_0774128 [Tanacetum coccineum]|uniref:Reverse transcriptase domain-containing protein n=1 Tax=Tanacetum coccineum TaxID=301880 RepID=A0ABQ4ZQQ2_9ASTR
MNLLLLPDETSLMMMHLHLTTPDLNRQPLPRPYMSILTPHPLVPHYGIQKWLLIQIFHNNISRIDRRKLDQFTQFCFSSLTEEEGWNKIEEYVQYQDDLWDEPSPSMNVSSISEAMQPSLRGRLKRACKQISFLKTPTREFGLKNPYLICDYYGGSHEADECEQRNPSEQVCLSGGDIYNDPSLLRFYQNNDTSPWGNSKRKEKGEDGPEWIVRRTITQDPPFPAPPRPTTNNFTEEETKKEGPEDAEPSITQEPTPRPSILYKPSKTSNPPFLSRLKKQKKDYEDEWLLSIFKQIYINLPFLKAMIHMPKGAKVLKDLLSHKEKLEKAASSVKLSEECSAIIRRNLPQKEGDPVVISSALSSDEKTRLLEVLQNHKGAIAWSIADIKGIDSSFCTHKILMEDECKPSVQPQRRVNPNIKELVKKEVIKLLDVGLIYPISNSPWVSPIQVVPKKGGMTVVKNEKDDLIP